MQKINTEGLISTSQLIESFDSFFTHTLKNEQNYQDSLKEWESFKELLSKDKLDIQSIFQHIASIQMKIGTNL